MSTTRKTEWDKFSKCPPTGSVLTAMRIFRAIFDAIEKNPEMRLIDAAPAILEQLRAP